MESMLLDCFRILLRCLPSSPYHRSLWTQLECPLVRIRQDISQPLLCNVRSLIGTSILRPTMSVTLRRSWRKHTGLLSMSHASVKMLAGGQFPCLALLPTEQDRGCLCLRKALACQISGGRVDLLPSSPIFKWRGV